MLTAEGLLMLLVWWVARVAVRRRDRQRRRPIDRVLRGGGAAPMLMLPATFCLAVRTVWEFFAAIVHGGGVR